MHGSIHLSLFIVGTWMGFYGVGEGVCMCIRVGRSVSPSPPFFPSLGRLKPAQEQVREQAPSRHAAVAQRRGDTLLHTPESRASRVLELSLKPPIRDTGLISIQARRQTSKQLN